MSRLAADAHDAGPATLVEVRGFAADAHDAGPERLRQAHDRGDRDQGCGE